jgi:hypothetical protein
MSLWSWEKEATELAFLVFPKLIHFFPKMLQRLVKSQLHITTVSGQIVWLAGRGRLIE